MNKNVAAVKLAKAGRKHLAYLNLMNEKEYEIPDDTPERAIDDRLLAVMLIDLDNHAKDCPGCTTPITDEIKEKMAAAKASDSRQARRRLGRIKEKLGI